MSAAYLDNSATTSVLPLVAEKMTEMMCVSFGNIASVHGLGIAANRAVEDARRQIADSLGAGKDEITFTSGGTEANNLAILGAAMAKRRSGNRIITTAVEHHSVLNACKELESRGFEVIYLPVDRSGSILVKDFAEVFNEQTILCSIMMVNNETGAVQPVEEIASIIAMQNNNCLLHTDCVQAYGKMPLTVGKIKADLLTISGHKIHGPKGVGALYIKKGVRIIPQTYGGNQENGLRSGTVASHQIVGMGAAVAAAPDPTHAADHAAALKQTILEGIRDLNDIVINSPENGSPFILNLSVPGVPSEVMIRALEQEDVYVSGGSACAKGGRSHVLLAQGLPAGTIDSALRISFSYDTPVSSAEQFVSALHQAYRVLRRKR